MPIATPFHEKTLPLCHSMRWKEWGGYYAVCSYDTCHEREYFAFRHSVGMIDVSPLFKYEVSGPDAGEFLARVMVRDMRFLKQNQVTYTCWCDDQGQVIDDGTVTRMDENHYRVTAAEPTLSWFHRFSGSYQVEIKDISLEVGALAVQGPNSREFLKHTTDADLDSLKFFRATSAKADGVDIFITRTGYTGDLGYEVWVAREDAPKLWEHFLANGSPFGLEPCGLDALDVTRVESGFIMNGVDYFSAHHCVIDERKSSPYELNLGWTVKLDRDPFIGQSALIKEKQNGSEWQTCGIEVDWDETETLFSRFDLPPQLPHGVVRASIPIYSGSTQVGYATSSTWSPTLKKNISIATLQTSSSKVGQKLEIEMTAEHQRHRVSCQVVNMPFFNPERKRFTPNG